MMRPGMMAAPTVRRPVKYGIHVQSGSILQGGDGIHIYGGVPYGTVVCHTKHIPCVHLTWRCTHGIHMDGGVWRRWRRLPSARGVAPRGATPGVKCRPSPCPIYSV